MTRRLVLAKQTVLLEGSTLSVRLASCLGKMSSNMSSQPQETRNQELELGKNSEQGVSFQYFGNGITDCRVQNVFASNI